MWDRYENNNSSPSWHCQVPVDYPVDPDEVFTLQDVGDQMAWDVARSMSGYKTTGGDGVEDTWKEKLQTTVKEKGGGRRIWNMAAVLIGT